MRLRSPLQWSRTALYCRRSRARPLTRSLLRSHCATQLARSATSRARFLSFVPQLCPPPLLPGWGAPADPAALLCRGTSSHLSRARRQTTALRAPVDRVAPGRGLGLGLPVVSDLDRAVPRQPLLLGLPVGARSSPTLQRAGVRAPVCQPPSRPPCGAWSSRCTPSVCSNAVTRPVASACLVLDIRASALCRRARR
eukprot:765814-Rhodomonas_salina.1